MAKLNRTCGICGKRYSYCGSCKVDSNKPTWMAVFCSDNCKKLYDVINDYRYKKLSKEKAFSKLNELNLSDIDNLPKNFRDYFTEIMTVEEKAICLISTEKTEHISEEFVKDEIIDDSNIIISEATEEIKEPNKEMVEKEEIKRPRKKRVQYVNSDF